MATRSRGQQLFKAKTISLNFRGDLTGALKKMEEKVEREIRGCVYVGARLLYQELLLHVPVGHTGALKNAIYHWHDDKKSRNGKQVYAIGVNKVKAPHWHLVEYGHWKQYGAYLGNDGKWHTVRKNGRPVLVGTPKWVGPKPYLRKAAAVMPRAMELVKAELREKLNGN
jgi:hypothetical protein